MENKTYTNCLPADFWDKSLRECIENNCLDAYAMLARGFWTCENKKDIKGKILLTGINPSYNGLPFDPEKMIESTPFAQLVPCEKRNGFWHKKAKQFGTLWNAETMSYLDLFPVRESSQTLFEIAFKKLSDLRGSILEVTQGIIEEIHPKLIVHANRSSMYYWGINSNDPKDPNDRVNPWMGYEVKRVEIENAPECMKNRLELFPFYEIIGFQDHNNRINKTKPLQGLAGSFIMEYVMGYRNTESTPLLYGPEEWKEIWKWVNSPKM